MHENYYSVLSALGYKDEQNIGQKQEDIVEHETYLDTQFWWWTDGHI